METIRVENAEHTCRVRLNRPERQNALNEQMRIELHDIVRALGDEPECRVLVFEGEGRSFSVGADLKDGAASVPDEWVARRHAAGRWQRLLDDLESLPQVTVASLHGHVIGGGAILAASCDLRIAADDLALSIPEVAVGLPLPWAGIPRLVREIGLPRTRELVMTGRVVGAEEALAWGFVQRVVARPDLPGETETLVSELLAMPAVPLSMTKGALRALGGEGLGTSWADADLVAWTMREPDTEQAANAYRQRRLNQPKPH